MASKVRNLIEYAGISDVLPQYTTGFGAFKEFIVEEMLAIPTAKPDMEQITKITVSIQIVETKVILTPIGTSLEGQTVTGYKVVVKGRLNQQVEYVANEPTQSVHAAHFSFPFCNFIVLPTTYDGSQSVIVTGYIEDIYAEQLDLRNIFKAVTLFIDAEIL